VRQIGAILQLSDAARLRRLMRRPLCGKPYLGVTVDQIAK